MVKKRTSKRIKQNPEPYPPFAAYEADLANCHDPESVRLCGLPLLARTIAAWAINTELTTEATNAIVGRLEFELAVVMQILRRWLVKASRFSGDARLQCLKNHQEANAQLIDAVKRALSGCSMDDDIWSGPFLAYKNSLERVAFMIQDHAEDLSESKEPRVIQGFRVPQKWFAAHLTDEVSGPPADDATTPRPEHASEGNTSVPEGESWSRIMPLRDIADRIYKTPKKWRSVLSHYPDRLKQIGGKGSRKWQIRLDGLPQNLIKELNRP